MPSPNWLARERYRLMRKHGVPYKIAECSHTSTQRFVDAMKGVGQDANKWPHLLRPPKGNRSQPSQRPAAVLMRQNRAKLRAAGMTDARKLDHWSRNQPATDYALRAIAAGRLATLPERPGLLRPPKRLPDPPAPKRALLMTPGAIRERARYYARKARRVAQSAAVTTAVLLLLCINGWGCGFPEPPSHYVIDSSFRDENPEIADQKLEVIRAAFDGWCDAVGYCPEEALWSDRGRVMLVDDLPEDEYTVEHCPEGRECKTSAHNVGGDNVIVARDRVRVDELDALWVVIAHEIGHYCTDHTKIGLMAPAQDEPIVQIDETAIRAWERGCNWR